MAGSDGQGSAPAAQIAQFRSDGITSTTGLRIPFFTDAFSRAFGFPDVLPENLISEETPLREERPYAPYVGLREVHYSRPALVTGYNLGTGPIRGVFRAPPIYGGGLFIVSGTTAYNVATGASAGTIAGLDKVRFAASQYQMVCVASGTAYLFDGANFNPISNGVLPPAQDVTWLDGRFVYMLIGTNQFFYSEINDAANETGLDFASAESSAFPTLGCAVLNDQLAIFGQTTCEFWSVSANANAPFQPNTGRGFQRGCLNRDTIAFADNTLMWVGDNRVVYRAGNAPERVSSSSIEDKLRQCSNAAGLCAWTATFEGHEFYVLNIPGVGTYAYDFSGVGTQAQAYGDSFQRGQWQAWTSWNHMTFRGQVATGVDDVVYVGDDTTNDLWLMQVGSYTDAGQPFTRKASAFIKIEEGNPRCINLVLHGVVGQGLATGQGSNPTVEMRYSDDQGRTFTDWRPATLGQVGTYKTRAVWERLGLLRAPGRLVEVRCSDPVNFVLSHLELNAVRPAR